jgi:hypothetical protein
MEHSHHNHKMEKHPAEHKMEGHKKYSEHNHHDHHRMMCRSSNQSGTIRLKTKVHFLFDV